MAQHEPALEQGHCRPSAMLMLARLAQVHCPVILQQAHLCSVDGACLKVPGGVDPRPRQLLPSQVQAQLLLEKGRLLSTQLCTQQSSSRSARPGRMCHHVHLCPALGPCHCTCCLPGAARAVCIR